ncbi:hypothetical protein [Xanthomonas sp. LMG 12462]|uniref:hypothetical protein n=1 Tax=Xanthomonas sp. LMG 12462 TaxID=1591134 RepID=UPI0012653AE0|nr:hypothetical protein [Xanthomonas sp. LMG 12462]KAB7764940.1 hypothetical protein CEK69_17800 [Xanthomonas sp. LMG 12462]
MLDLLAYESSIAQAPEILADFDLSEKSAYDERKFIEDEVERITSDTTGSSFLGILDTFDIDTEVSASLEGAAWSDLTFEVPDFKFDQSGQPTDFVPEIEITHDARALQQAIEFLRRIDELSCRNVAWIADIILARRWSAAQRCVVELLKSGFSLRSIYLSFLLSEHWRESDVYDERFDQGLHQFSWQRSCFPRITWEEAVQLIAFHGEDCTLEEVIEFIEQERELWRRSSALKRDFPRFKGYLLRQRLAKACQVPSGLWYRTLDPRDARRFDGSANPEYTSQWWEDELPVVGGVSYLQRRIYVGDPLSFLIVELDDGLHWLEE